MKRPNKPSVPPSEPEIEQYIAEKAMEDARNGEFDGLQICLPYAKEYLAIHGLDVDSDGFIIDKETGEYAVPYVFGQPPHPTSLGRTLAQVEGGACVTSGRICSNPPSDFCASEV